jgi:hypothetical protein
VGLDNKKKRRRWNRKDCVGLENKKKKSKSWSRKDFEGLVKKRRKKEMK